jgi:hypothetical protein
MKTHRPPRDLLSTPRRTVIEALLHTICEPPPPLSLLVIPDGFHIFLKVTTCILEVCDEQIQRRVMVDRVVHDVVPSNGAKDTRPNVPVDLFVLVRAFWFELCERSGGLHYRGENPYAP